MIAFYRNAAIATGKLGSAIAFAHQIAAYVKDKHGVELSIAMPVAGNPNRIGWAARYENLAAFEAKMTAITSDPRYQELAAKGSENFIAGTIHDELWRTL
jgi:alcohol dehydrogenase class IV